MLKVYLGFREENYQSKFLYSALLITSLKRLFPISTKLEIKLIDFINNEISRSSTTSKSLRFGLDIGIQLQLWDYSNFSGCIIILLSYKDPKFINLKYSTTPTKLEFEILLDIASANIKDRNFEEVIFKDEIRCVREIQYKKGLGNLGNTTYMNSVIQCILNNPHIKLFFQTFIRVDNLQFDKNIYPLLYATYQLNLQLHLNKSTYNEVRILVRAMKEYMPIYKDNNSHDASKFLQSFLEILHKEFLVYFNSCTRSYNNLFEENLYPANSRLNLNNSYFKNLFLGLTSNTVTCDFCNYTESVNFPTILLQLYIPEKKLALLNIKIHPYDTNQSQSTYNLQVTMNSGFSLLELKRDISELISVPIRRLAVASEFSIDRFTKELRAIEYEGESIDYLANLNCDIYFFELPEHYTKEGWIYIFLNQGIGQGNNFIHLGYSLCLIPIVHNITFKYLCECLISDIDRVSNFQLNSQYQQGIIQQGYNSVKMRKPNLTYPIHIVENAKTFYLKQDEFVPCNKKIFQIFKTNMLNFNYNNDKIAIKIQNQTEFNTVKPIFNGDNIFIKWSDHYFTGMFYQLLDQKQSLYLNTKGSEYSKHLLNFVSAPLKSLAYTPLEYINHAKDLFNGKEYKNQNIEHETSLECCIEDYLKTTYLTPQENLILNWEYESCCGNYGQKSEKITEFPPYLIIIIDGFKPDCESNKNTDNNSKLVKYPFDIQFNDNGKWLNYSLISVCGQFGNLNDDHYIATCKSPSNGKWYNYDDGIINLIDEKDIASLSSYILIYQRRDAFICNEPLNLQELPLKTKQLCTNKH